MINNSSAVQNFFLPAIGEFGSTAITFRNHATAGERVTDSGPGSHIAFIDEADAGSATFAVSGLNASRLSFSSTASAANSTITISDDALLTFSDGATAANATITLNPYSTTQFFSESSLGSATVTAVGGNATQTGGAGILIYSEVNATGATIYNRAATAAGATGAKTIIITNGLNPTVGGTVTIVCDGSAFPDPATAGLLQVGTITDVGTTTLIAHGGTNGGAGGILRFRVNSLAPKAQVTLDGNGTLDLSARQSARFELGALAGDGGQVLLGSTFLLVGTNPVDTTFAGVIQDDGTNGILQKAGASVLTLTGASTYAGGTTVKAGTLLVANTESSATGTGPVSVAGGRLGGGGNIAGAVTVGTGLSNGSTLQPSFGAIGKVTLRIRSLLTFKSDATYSYRLKSKTTEVVANGVTIAGGAQFVLTAPSRQLPAGTTATVISNTSSTPINGTFANLPDGATITSGGNTYQANYEGGDGNDLTLTVQP